MPKLGFQANHIEAGYNNISYIFVCVVKVVMRQLVLMEKIPTVCLRIPVQDELQQPLQRP